MRSAWTHQGGTHLPLRLHGQSARFWRLFAHETRPRNLATYGSGHQHRQHAARMTRRLLSDFQRRGGGGRLVEHTGGLCSKGVLAPSERTALQNIAVACIP